MKQIIWMVCVLGLVFQAGTGRAGVKKDSPAGQDVRLLSPSREVQLKLTNEGGKLVYEVLFQGNTMILPSRLLWEVDGELLGNGVQEMSVRNEKKEKSRYPVVGIHAMAENEYRGLTLEVGEKSGAKYQVECRAYNDGVAFRYRITKEQRMKIDDHTDFRLPQRATCWLQTNRKCYENAYRACQVGQLQENIVAGPPVTVKCGKGVYALITEGGLVNFGGMGLKVVAPDCFQSCLEGETFLTGEVATPWRIVMVGDLNSLVNNDIVSDVSEPLAPVFKPGTDWIKPGNCVWSWLAGYGVTPENMKRFTDWAAELGIPYNLVDEGWSHWQDTARGLDAWQMVAELVEYSRKKGVEILLWKAYPDRKGIEGIQTAERRQRFFQKCKELGVAGLKIDFFDCESQEITRYYQETLEDAARYGLIINYHGANKPTGLNRTYPNELSREGIRGLEFGCSEAKHDVITPFTRFVAGHADYTAMAFQPNRMGNTTEAHQIAMSAIFHSPLRCYGGRPEDYLSHPAREIFLSVPTVWDETIVLPPSEIGECVVMAYRKGTDCFVAALTDQAREGIEIPLSFLKKGNYRAGIVSDGPDGQKKCEITEKSYTNKDKLVISMNAGGGFLARIKVE